MLTIERLGQLLVDNRPALPAAPAKEDGAAHFLHLEYQLLDRLMYKNGNSHQRTKYFGRLQQIRSRLRKIDFKYLENLLSTFDKLYGKESEFGACFNLYLHFLVLEECLILKSSKTTIILELAAVAQPALSQLIETKSEVISAFYKLRSRVDAKIAESTSIGSLPLELKSRFEIPKPPSQDKLQQKAVRKADVAAAPKSASVHDLSKEGEDLGELVGDDLGQDLQDISAPPVKQPPKQVAVVPGQHERSGQPPKRKYPESPQHSLESAAKRAKVVNSTPSPTAKQVVEASTAHKPKTPSEVQRKDQKTNKNSFSHSNPHAVSQKASFFAKSEPSAPAAPQKKPVSTKPGGQVKTTDQLFAALLGSKKKK